MSKMMIIGLKDEAGLWLVDFEAGSVTAVEGNREDFISCNEKGDSGEKDLDVAVSFNVKETAFSGIHYKSGVADVAVGFETKDAAFSGIHYKSNVADVAVGFDTKVPAFSGIHYKTPETIGHIAN
ncbi:hypothetical protein DSM25558_5484 [Agrobacterium sp. DSM 25558]|uniref:hypothetical protein n=1 Tax=Agrobacterium sp. DSM 25558 TaxID=1907665 RepID=UPI0009724D51|nr:hypothetical protein [Agrobacterium sp. DSM 25558]SCX32557.1 hypothetical protein DSM25558_5484 [Agrobacterium sp. DSM 25558]